MEPGPDENRDLLWYYLHSAAEVGLHAQNYSDSGGAHGEPQGPTHEQMKAARRQTAIMRVLRRIPKLHRAVLFCCYDGPEPPPNVCRECGRPLAHVVMVFERSGETVDIMLRVALRKLVLQAHQSYEAADAEVRSELRETVQQAATEREVEVECASAPDGEPLMNKHETEVAKVAAWVREMGL